ncbi:helicase associated domain-containing protein [Streptomyces roseoverticillatus]|uniref:Helicase associated domain-containing protein n=1 Tax=Streptomyces roseoverticillatus TaxID=66429 RepID=A0ABV3J3K9_9ACTN
MASLKRLSDHQQICHTQNDKWVLNLRAARQFHGREGHLNVPRKHIEQLEPEGGPTGPQGGTEGLLAVKLGMVLDNIRKRADKLTEQRRADLDALGMRWTTTSAGKNPR